MNNLIIILVEWPNSVIFRLNNNYNYKEHYWQISSSPNKFSHIDIEFNNFRISKQRSHDDKCTELSS